MKFRRPTHLPSFKFKPNLTPKLRQPLTPRGRAALLAAIFVLGSIMGGVVGAGWQAANHESNLSEQKIIVNRQSQLISQIVKKMAASVVSVNVSIEEQVPNYDIFGVAEPVQQEVAGTGIIISDKGLIVTNRHVVPAGTSQVSVTLSNGIELTDVSVVGRTNPNDSLDIAFLKINDAKGHKLVPAKLGDSSKVQVGDNVVAIGNALGQFENTVTVGIISGYGRNVQAGDSDGNNPENLDDLFQTDAAINAGNSGGPLVNLNGQVIGINTAVATEGAQNIGFAIPLNDVRGLIEQVINTGQFAKPYIGVRYIPLSADVAEEFDLKVHSGAFIVPSESGSSSVIKGSPAARAGLKEGDVITAINGAKIDTSHSLISRLGAYRPGEKVELTIERGNKTIYVHVTLEALPENL